jgi:hypothetical protein
MYTIETSYPRSDAAYGLLLEGDGKGNFKSIDHNVSGFYVPYDVRSMVNLNGIDNSYIAVGCNNDSLRVYKVNKIPMPSTGSK